MKKSHQNSVEGFVLKRRPQQVVGSNGLQAPRNTPNQQASHLSSPDQTSSLPRTSGLSPIRRSDIDESLQAIDNSSSDKKDNKFKKLFGKKLTKRKVIKRSVLAVFVILLLIGSYTAINALVRTAQVFKGNLLSVLQHKDLKTDSNGRTNILVFGTSEDDPAHIAQQSGTELTDSIMLVSVDQKAKNAAMVSIPRDLWVKYGKACVSGYEGKINVAYQCGKGNNGSVDDGAALLSSVISKDIGVTPQYYAKVSYSALKGAVDALGGITVKIESDDPRGVYDRNFDWQCGYKCKLVYWTNGEHQMNGEQALALARARNDAGGYGLSRGNFDREQYQQKIILAIKQKALSSGALANPVTVNKLIDTVGANIKTSFDASEIQTLVGLMKDIKPENIHQVSLVDDEKPMVTTGNVDGQSIVKPVAGLYDFSQLSSYVVAGLSGDTSITENASIEVINVSAPEGSASGEVDKLAGKGLTATAGNGETMDALKSLQWYDLSNNKMPGTKKKLAAALGVASSGSKLPTGIESTADFVIILGSGYSSGAGSGSN